MYPIFNWCSISGTPSGTVSHFQMCAVHLNATGVLFLLHSLKHSCYVKHFLVFGLTLSCWVPEPSKTLHISCPVDLQYLISSIGQTAHFCLVSQLIVTSGGNEEVSYVPCKIAFAPRVSPANVKGVPCACENCFWFRCCKWAKISVGTSTTCHLEQFFGSSSGCLGISMRVTPLFTCLSLKCLIFLKRCLMSSAFRRRRSSFAFCLSAFFVEDSSARKFSCLSFVRCA